MGNTRKSPNRKKTKEIKDDKQKDNNAKQDNCSDKHQDCDELCPTCSKPLDFSENDECDTVPNILCEICQKWYHINCMKLKGEDFDLITEFGYQWYCQTCEPRFLSSSRLFLYCQHLQTQQKCLNEEIKDLKLKLAEFEKPTEVIEVPKSNEDIKKVCLEILKTDVKKIAEDEVKVSLEKQKEDANQNSEFPTLLNANTPKNTIDEFINKHVKPAIKSTVPNSENICTRQDVSDMLEEEKNIQKIKLNLVISGVEESNSEEEDLEKATNLIKRELKITPMIDKVQRCGKMRPSQDGSPTKPRMLKLFMQNPRNRKDILQNAKKLRQSSNAEIKENVYIRPDQTLKQQLESKNLRDQLRLMNQQHGAKKYYIRRGEIVEREEEED